MPHIIDAFYRYLRRMALSNKILSPTCAPAHGDIAPYFFFEKNVSIRWRNMSFNDAILDPKKPKFRTKTALFGRRATQRVALDPGNAAFESPTSPVSKTCSLAKKRANWASWQLVTSGDPPPAIRHQNIKLVPGGGSPDIASSHEAQLARFFASEHV